MTERTIAHSSQIENSLSLSAIKSKARQSVDVVHSLIDNKMTRQMEITVIGSLVHVLASEVQITETDGVSGVENQGTQNTYKIGSPILDGSYRSFVDSWLDVATGAVTGSFDTPTAPPSHVSGDQVYLGLQATPDGVIQAVWSTVGNPADVNTMSWDESSLKLGFVQLTASGTSSGWGGFNTLSNTSVTNLPMGGGAGGGGDSSFKIKNIVGSTATINKGFVRLSNGEVLATGSGTTSTTVGVEISINLTTVLGTTPANNTTYYLYVDRQNLGAAVTLSDDGRKIIQVYSTSHFKLLTTTPDNTNPYRYLYVGYVHTADSGNAWTGTGGFRGSAPSKLYNLLNEALLVPEYKLFQITTSVSAATNYAHGLSDTPQIVVGAYFDGSILMPEAVENFLYSKDSTNVTLVTDGLTFGTSGQYLNVECFYLPSRGKSVLANQGRYESSWMVDTSVSALAHGLTDIEDIKGISVLNWDGAVGGLCYPVDFSELVSSWDNSNIYLNWIGLSPASNNRYKVVTGGSPLPASIPTYIGGYTKMVGFGPGSYPTLSSALSAAVAGDSILVNNNQTFTAKLSISVSDIKITFMPDVILNWTSGTEGIEITGNRVELNNAHVKISGSGTWASGFDIQSNDCVINKGFVESNHASCTITNAYYFTVGSNRNYINGTMLVTLGTITNQSTDAGTNNESNIRG